MVYYKFEEILNEYRAEKETFIKLGEAVTGILRKEIGASEIPVIAVEHRVKEEASLLGKLEKKGEKYGGLKDITDILGTRVICYFQDDVDRVAEIIEKNFVIDKENSVDKRMLLEPTSFGYLSLHYVCSLKPDSGYGENLTGKKFEVQIRTILQHAWSAIDHDLSYKTEFGVPSRIVRDFARVAGLLELADKEFMSIRDGVKTYGTDLYNAITEDRADDLQMDMISLVIFVKYAKTMKDFLEKISSAVGVKITDKSTQNFLPQLKMLGLHTFGDLNACIKKDGDTAVKLARLSLKNTGTGELPADYGLRFLGYARIINGDYDADTVVSVLNVNQKDKDRALMQYGKLMALSDLVKD